MSTVMRDLLLISMTWTDQSHVLAQEMSQSGFVHTMTVYLHAGCYINTFDQVSSIQLIFSRICYSYSLGAKELWQ